MHTDIAYIQMRKVLSWMKRRYDDMMAIFVNAIAKAYRIWQMKRYYSALVVTAQQVHSQRS